MKKIFIAAGTVLLGQTVIGCVSQGYSGPSAYTTEGQGPNGNFTYRSPIQNQPTDCTIRTRETGEVVDGQWITYNRGGRAERVCVSSPDAGTRRRGTDPYTQVRQGFGVINQGLGTLNRATRVFGRMNLNSDSTTEEIDDIDLMLKIDDAVKDALKDQGIVNPRGLFLN